MEAIPMYPSLPIATGNEDSYWQFNWTNHSPYCDPATSTLASTCGLQETAFYSEQHIVPCYSVDSPCSTYTPISTSATVDAPNNSYFDAVSKFEFSTASNEPGNTDHSDITSFQIHEDDGRDDVSINEDDPDHFRPGLKASTQRLTSISQSKHRHCRSESAVETSIERAKRAHTMVERNYRERLNDKIAELGVYLFSASDTRTKPSKPLIMARARARLQELAKRNKALEEEVVKLQERVSILEHVVASKGKAIASGG